MKYIITESQYKFLVESDAPLWFRRRANKETMTKFIMDGEINYPTLCDDFGDEFDYADNVIRYAVDEFLTIDEDLFESEDYDDIHDTLTEMCKDWYGEYLFEIYRSTCSEENGYGLNEQGYWGAGAEKIASEKQKCGLDQSGGDNSREMRRQDKELAASNKVEAKANAAELKKAFDMSYDRNNDPLSRDLKRQVYSQFQQLKDLVDDGQGQYKPEQKFAIVNKVLDWVHNVPTISYTKKLSTKFNNPNIKSATIQDIIGYAKQMGWDNFINWYNSGGPDIK